MCAVARNCEKITKTPILGFKVINVDKSKKPVTSACYDKQHVYTYLQPFSHQTSQQWQNNVFLKGYLSLTPLFKGNPLHPGAQSFVSKKLAKAMAEMRKAFCCCA